MTFELLEGATSEYLLALAIRAANRTRECPRGIMGEVVLWCGLVIHELGTRQARIVRIPEVIAFPPPPRRQLPTYLTEAGATPHVSTLDLRRHAFAAYAMAMAFHGPEEAFDAAVTVTLQRAGNWTLAAAAQHTKRFIVPAYERAFPAARKDLRT
ncbi:MAG: hypothetical protein JWO51_101 [Rhodospirillales bacterium]|nr:hypothetical protein [Rhodospirillales bacterium]